MTEKQKQQPIFKKIRIHKDLNNVILPDIKRVVNCGSRRHPKDYLKLYCGYDCETTQVRTVDGWQGAVYIHQLAIAASCDVCEIYLLRTWNEILDLFDQIRQYYGLSKERRIIIWDANLSFEFSFLQHRFVWDEVFAKEERQPLLASSGGLDFRECLTISGGNLAYLAKTYCHTKKAAGDLDYSKPRNTKTPLTTTELGYCIADVLILAEFSYVMFRDYIIPRHKIPMTKTGILSDKNKRRFDKECQQKKDYSASKEAYKHYIKSSFPDHQTYCEWYNYLFRGGYVHANCVFAGILNKGVDMYDITSSYPSVMLTDYVPVTPFESVPFDKKHLKDKCCILFCTFYGIRSTTDHSIESKNKIIEASGAEYDNGRLIRADTVRVMLTELDYATYKEFYTWDKLIVHDFQIAKRGKLPRFLRDNLLESYQKKNALKAAGLSHTQEYTVEKSEVNTYYGLTVKRLRLDTITFDNQNGWITKKLDKDYGKEVDKALLLAQWGIWITAHARRNLLSMVYRLTRAGVHCIYSDTDSIKLIADYDAKTGTYTTNKRAAKIIRKYNIRREKHLRRRGYRSPFVSGLGSFDCETPDGPVWLKTLGAKRYIIYDGKDVKATIAGLPKDAIKFHGGDVMTTFDFFSENGMFLDTGASLKKTTNYCDFAYDLYINGEWMHEESGVAIYEIPFSLRLSDDYAAYLWQMKEKARTGFTA